MTLENQIKFWDMIAEACEGDERNNARFCLQLRNWLIELKERREQAQRETGEFEQMRRNNMFLEMRIGHLLQSKFIRSFDAKKYGTGSYIRDIEDADKLVDKWTQYPSEDEQPPEGIEVLVTLSSGDVVVDFFSGSEFLTYGPRVVAWMRFPEPWERWCS